MSILQQEVNNKPTVEQVVGRIAQDAKQVSNGLIRSYETALKRFWKNPNYTPAEISAAMGTSAVEYFQLSASLGQYLNSIIPNCVDQINADNVGAFTPNEDGSVSIF